ADPSTSAASPPSLGMTPSPLSSLFSLLSSLLSPIGRLKAPRGFSALALEDEVGAAGGPAGDRGLDTETDQVVGAGDEVAHRLGEAEGRQRGAYALEPDGVGL